MYASTETSQCTPQMSYYCMSISNANWKGKDWKIFIVTVLKPLKLNVYKFINLVWYDN